MKQLNEQDSIFLGELFRHALTKQAQGRGLPLDNIPVLRSKQHKSFETICLAVNIGFFMGMDCVMDLMRGEDVVMLNNDTNTFNGFDVAAKGMQEIIDFCAGE